MDYLTTVEAGQNWGISSRRVALLASQGRIEGAVCTGKCWLIPKNAKKPEDSRRKENKAGAGSSDRYVFPYIIYCVHSPEQAEQFTEEEAKLYQLCHVFETADFETALRLAETLLASENIYIRIGALYHLPFIHMYLGNYAETEKYSIFFKTAAHNVKDHKAELELLIRAFDSELERASVLVEKPVSIDIHSFPSDLLPAVATTNLVSDMLRYQKANAVPDIASHELICEMVRTQGYYFCAMYLHLCLSYCFGAANDPEKEEWHIRQAIDIGLEHDTVFTLASSLTYNPVTTVRLLNERAPEAVENFRLLAGLFVKARNGYAEYRGNSTLLPRLKEADYQLISYCLKNCSVENMAAAFGISKSGMNRRLSGLYKKLGVRSKNELIKVFRSSVLDWGET